MLSVNVSNSNYIRFTNKNNNKFTILIIYYILTFNIEKSIRVIFLRVRE